MQLDWDYDKRTVDVSMPGYVKKKLQEYGHVMKSWIQMCSYSPELKIFGNEAQALLPPNKLTKLNGKGIKRVQQIVGSILYYAWAVHMTVLKALSSIAVEQMNATEKNNGKMHTIIGLPFTHFKCKSLLHCIRHDIKHTLRCIVLVGSKGSEPRMWTFIHGMDAKKWRTHLFEWGIPCQLNDPEICCRIRGGSRTRRVISHLPNGHNFQTHADRNGTPSTKNTGTL